MSYDSKCFDLAEHFLDVDEIVAGSMLPVTIDAKMYARLCSQLAQHIQGSVEDWIQHDLEDLLTSEARSSMSS